MKSVRGAAKMRHFALTVVACMLVLTIANMLTWFVPRRFGLAGSELGSSWTWLGGHLLELPFGLALAFTSLMVLVGFAWRLHTHYLRGVAAWCAAAVALSAVSMVAGSIVHGIPLRVFVFVIPDAAEVAIASTGIFAAAAVVGTLVGALLERFGARGS